MPAFRYSLLLERASVSFLNLASQSHELRNAVLLKLGSAPWPLLARIAVAVAFVFEIAALGLCFVSEAADRASEAPDVRSSVACIAGDVHAGLSSLAHNVRGRVGDTAGKLRGRVEKSLAASAVLVRARADAAMGALGCSCKKEQ